MAVLAAASKIVIVPSYGMAGAEAQHRLRVVFDALTKRGVGVTFGIHPVARRTPDLNVLLAEADTPDIPNDKLLETDDVNDDLPQTDAALIIGASDVTRTAACSDTTRPIYGVRLVEVDKARAVIVIQRNMAVRFAGVDTCPVLSGQDPYALR
jgi:H+-translocating NAD(P) transhydrogenase subunit beta